jgi:hypothetical protein
MSSIVFEKLGFVYSRNEAPENHWWQSHTMAPTAIEHGDEVIRVYLGCWDVNGISRIGWIDVDKNDPTKVLNVCDSPALDIGEDGCFDENGVFPGHAFKFEDKVILYYTGFQLGQKIRHYNFGGAAVSNDGDVFTRLSKSPVLDRSEEGLFVRAGQSVIVKDGIFHTVYSAGSSWVDVAGNLRPVYDVIYQTSTSPFNFDNIGNLVIKHDSRVEHGLGRPQIIELNGEIYIFYTRRKLDMKYSFGFSRFSTNDLVSHRLDYQMNIDHSEIGFDSEMIYFPSVVQVKTTGRVFLFYSGNGFGGKGLGVMELHIIS